MIFTMLELTLKLHNYSRSMTNPVLDNIPASLEYFFLNSTIPTTFHLIIIEI